MAFQDTLAADQIQVAELFHFVFADGSEKFFTSHEDAITFDGDEYSPAVLTRTHSAFNSDLSVGEIRVTIPADDSYVDVDAVVNFRILDMGRLTIYQVDRSDLGNNRMIFSGTVATVAVNANTIEIVLRDAMNSLLRSLPRREYSESCPFRMGDPDCKVDPETFKVGGTAGAGSDESTIVDAALMQAEHYFRGGYVLMTSGANNGLRRPIKAFANGTIELLNDFPASTLAGTFFAYPHCEKSYEKCGTIFSNTDNFGAFQYIPEPDQVYT